MKIALHDSGEEHLQLVRQLGVEYVGPGKSKVLAVADLVQKKEYYAERGPSWDASENLLQGSARMAAGGVCRTAVPDTGLRLGGTTTVRGAAWH